MFISTSSPNRMEAHGRHEEGNERRGTHGRWQPDLGKARGSAAPLLPPIAGRRVGLFGESEREPRRGLSTPPCEPGALLAPVLCPFEFHARGHAAERFPGLQVAPRCGTGGLGWGRGSHLPSPHRRRCPRGLSEELPAAVAVEPGCTAPLCGGHPEARRTHGRTRAAGHICRCPAGRRPLGASSVWARCTFSPFSVSLHVAVS